ncbi:uncharacterized protein LOC130282445 [Hyla sarda]|uniref:uncharacterized protein LOC130282445 n=1 Tax=Hyla sarda TaxID=327740 RepID=UPI0024C36338|nr:uncharacterized protein LOC130282445 [Hyla sarda]XP_056386677.1 uncharacterized protein LOC130282445 [Hyla sarda]XP_056386679.1 uncharacterized protein LOC130282445 [Hyla sarda]XP_056386680.1 uncharacterized protein LOC130282445 [Hyla sarda]
MSKQPRTEQSKSVTSEKRQSTNARQRGQTFHHKELVDMVRLIDELSATRAPRGQVNQQKHDIMSQVATYLKEKYGTFHTPKQVKKRFSDLKVRETRRLGSIRRHIAEEHEPKEDTQLQAKCTDEEEPSVSGNCNKPDENQEMLVCPETEYFTLHLQPIDSEKFEQLPEPQRENPETKTIRFLDRRLCQMQEELTRQMSTLIQKMEEKINAKLDHVLARITVLEEKCNVLNP